ncbi:type II toxin-antitoxin system HicB family antitoxin [Candidatus Parcubacteria bacterium]|nr:type II toxin-antitoxin system HicB family antitoxin [Patescibacteria group bacterium]MBU4380627.1 type II toxin-antitoxin system HicB family antitoxin [Patescibacteria group bacterium]MCG2688975.1 type II toxin-antitoxin system HicB family antitoxin [Candidatus Parcubacteria bacterium]
MEILNFRTIIEQDEMGYFVASAPAIPGCHSQGKTYEEALINIQEAIELCLEVAQELPWYRESIDFFRGTSMRFLGIATVPVSYRKTRHVKTLTV